MRIVQIGRHKHPNGHRGIPLRPLKAGCAVGRDFSTSSRPITGREDRRHALLGKGKEFANINLSMQYLVVYFQACETQISGRTHRAFLVHSSRGLPMTTSVSALARHSTSRATSDTGSVKIATLCAVAALFLGQVAHQNLLDLDLFHQMALFRVALQQGWLPFEDLFSFVSTTSPSVHYEWGNGAILYPVVTAFGTAGLLTLKYLLTVAAAIMAIHAARQRHADWPIICALAPIATLLMVQGFSTIRAGLFTLVFVALLLVLLNLDRRGHRWWVLPWLAVHVVWLNIHPGFIVGMALCGLHWLEQLIRYRRVQWHLIGAGIAMIALVLVNPYGLKYPPALWHILTAPLPPIPEWLPMWSCLDWSVVVAYSVSLALLAYAAIHAGWHRSQGIFIVLVCAAAAMQHTRHSYLFAIAWICYLPGWLQLSPLGQMIDRVWASRPRPVIFVCIALSAVGVWSAITAKPWTLHIPTSLSDPTVAHTHVIYPVGAVEHLKQQQFSGNVMTHYNDGSYVMWHLWPLVKVGLDSRNDVGYSYERISEISAFYDGKPGWHDTLQRYPADLILICRSRPLARLIAEQSDWQLCYRDDAFDLWARPGLVLPSVDRSGQQLVGRFP